MSTPASPPFLSDTIKLVVLLELIIYYFKQRRLPFLFSRIEWVTYLENELRKYQIAMVQMSVMKVAAVLDQEAFDRAEKLLPIAQTHIAELKVQILEMPSWQTCLPALPPLYGGLTKAEDILTRLNMEISKSSISNHSKLERDHTPDPWGPENDFPWNRPDRELESEIAESDIQDDVRSVTPDSHVESDSALLGRDILPVTPFGRSWKMERQHQIMDRAVRRLGKYTTRWT